MPERIPAGTWVELRRVALAPDERAPQLPEETRRVPLELRVKGVLAHDAEPGEPAEVVTSAGRRLRGTLEQANPAYTHGFGAPVAALRGVGEELRAMLRAREKAG